MREPSILRPLQGWRRHILLHGSIAAAITLVLAVIGPLATFVDFGFGKRLLYWGAMVLPGFVIYETALRVAFTLRPPTRPSWPTTLLAAKLVGSVFHTAVVLAVETQSRDRLHLSLATLAEVYLYVVVMTAVVAALPVGIELYRYGAVLGILPEFLVTGVSPPESDPGPAVDTAPATPPFLRRVPERLGQELMALEMEDHYIRVHTALGSDLILMRLRDAIEELTGLSGKQVHRSYWVAADAVAQVQRADSGKLTLVLRNGLKVPVSRTYAADVRAAGWLDRTAPSEARS